MFTSISHRTHTILLVLILAVGVGIVAMLASGARGGPLDPPGPPVGTMHTLDDTAPVWDQKLNSTNGAPGGVVGGTPAGCDSDRFKCVMTYSQCASFCITVWPAVLDRETGLVWQRVPPTTTALWFDAVDGCEYANTAVRDGWRLPTTAEILSLRDESVGADPQLPAGSPFVVTSDSLWTSTLAGYTGGTQLVELAAIYPLGRRVLADPDHIKSNFWCVRGATSNR